MNRGVVEQVGTPYEVYRTPARRFAAAFVGTMNFVPARRRRGGVQIGGLHAALRRGRTGPASSSRSGRRTCVLGPGGSGDGRAILLKGAVRKVTFLGREAHYTLTTEAGEIVAQVADPDPRPPRRRRPRGRHRAAATTRSCCSRRVATRAGSRPVREARLVRHERATRDAAARVRSLDGGARGWPGPSSSSCCSGRCRRCSSRASATTTRARSRSPTTSRCSRPQSYRRAIGNTLIAGFGGMSGRARPRRAAGAASRRGFVIRGRVHHPDAGGRRAGVAALHRRLCVDRAVRRERRRAAGARVGRASRCRRSTARRGVILVFASSSSRTSS